KETCKANRTGNNSYVREVDNSLWAILNDAFASRAGLSREVILGTNLDNDDDASAEKSEASANQFQESTAMLQRQHEPTRRFREMQLQLLKRFVDRQ
ncbi:hypothetical protein PHYSODRAFT_489195, partial [Phytophthora sojae]